MSDEQLEKYIRYAEQRDKFLFQSVMRLMATCDEIKLLIGQFHERALGEDGDKLIGELNHRVKMTMQQALLRMPSETGAWLDNLDRPGDSAPPQS